MDRRGATKLSLHMPWGKDVKVEKWKRPKLTVVLVDVKPLIPIAENVGT